MSDSRVKEDQGGIRSQVRGYSAGQFMADAIQEYYDACQKFPSSEGVLAALMEEVGELAKAMMEETWDRVYKEAVQVAAMAARVACEGDPTMQKVRERRVPSESVSEEAIRRAIGPMGKKQGHYTVCSNCGYGQNIKVTWESSTVARGEYNCWSCGERSEVTVGKVG